MVKPHPQFYTSPLSRHCAENLPGDFHYLDGDEVLFRHSAQPIIYARETGILRILESKNPNEEIRRSQREVFPLLASAIDQAVESGIFAEGSGVFVLECEGEDFSKGATVRKVRPGAKNELGLTFSLEHDMTGEQLSRFLRCRRPQRAP